MNCPRVRNCGDAWRDKRNFGDSFKEFVGYPFMEKSTLFLSGLAAAVVTHSFYNHFFLPPILITLCFVICLPLLIVFVYEQSEQATRKWLGVGFDTDVDLLDMITTDGISGYRVGQYLESLKKRFPSEVVADMLCYLREA